MSGWLCLALFGAGTYPPIANRDYAIDLYQGTVLGSTKIVGMGGASLGIAEGSAAVGTNPAAAAVRSATSMGDWDWDWHLDWLSPALGSDFDDSGNPAGEDDHALLLTAGLLGQWRGFGLGLTATLLRHVVTVPGAAGAREQADPTTEVVNLALARSFFEEWLTVGLGLRVGIFSVGRFVGNQRTSTLFELQGGTLDAGALLRPAESDWRIGASLSLPVTGETVNANGCDPLSCDGFILPGRVVLPWEVALGVGWRRGATPWNRHVSTPWRDERELVLDVDVVLSGPVTAGTGIEGFLAQELQPSGRDPSLSVRAGAEYEWIPGWLRVRLGSYWEPGRFESIEGRVHGTAGVEVRLFGFRAWERQYRLRAALALDLADRYGNGAVSIGFWH